MTFKLILFFCFNSFSDFFDWEVGNKSTGINKNAKQRGNISRFVFRFLSWNT